MNLHEKLIEVRKSTPYLQKENSGFQYKYVSSSQVLSSLKAKMDELKVLLVPQVTDARFTEILRGKNSKGNETVDLLTELEMNFTWVNAEKPEETLTCSWYGQGVDTSGEKGVGKALTYSEKYFMLKFFNIPTDKDDPDSFQEKNQENGSTPAKTENKTSTKNANTGDSGRALTLDEKNELRKKLGDEGFGSFMVKHNSKPTLKDYNEVMAA